MLGLIPGLDLVPLAETEHCCGAAGSYNLTQPEMSAVLGARKVENILATGARAVFTGNVGCLLQIARHLRGAAGPDSGWPILSMPCGRPTAGNCPLSVRV